MEVELENEASHGLSFKDLVVSPPAQHFCLEEFFGDDDAVAIVAPPDGLEVLAVDNLPELLEEELG